MSNPILVTVRYTVKDGKREEFLPSHRRAGHRHGIARGRWKPQIRLLLSDGFRAGSVPVGAVGQPRSTKNSRHNRPLSEAVQLEGNLCHKRGNSHLRSCGIIRQFPLGCCLLVRRILGAGFAHKRISHRRCACALSDFVRHLHRKRNRLLQFAVSVQNRRDALRSLGLSFLVRLLRGAMRLSRYLRQLYAAVQLTLGANALTNFKEQVVYGIRQQIVPVAALCLPIPLAWYLLRSCRVVLPRLTRKTLLPAAGALIRYLCADQRRAAPAGRRHGISPADNTSTSTESSVRHAGLTATMFESVWHSWAVPPSH